MAFTNKVGKPKASENWQKVELETAPATPGADIAETDYAIVNDSDPGAGKNTEE